jgi:hypothetical protein
VRPPGHHAGPRGVVTSANDPHGSHGFCLLNNVAIGAAYPMNTFQHRGIQRVAILDFDVHHGNGTQVGDWARCGHSPLAPLPSRACGVAALRAAAERCACLPLRGSPASIHRHQPPRAAAPLTRPDTPRPLLIAPPPLPPGVRAQLPAARGAVQPL